MSFLLLPPAFPSVDGGGWYSGGASRCRAAEHHWIFGDSDDNRARAGHGMFCAASSNPRSIPVGYGLTDGCISDGYHSDCSSCKRDLWTLDNRHARVSRPPCDHISWPPSLSFLINARLSELGRGRERPEAGKQIRVESSPATRHLPQQRKVGLRWVLVFLVQAPSNLTQWQ